MILRFFFKGLENRFKLSPEAIFLFMIWLGLASFLISPFLPRLMMKKFHLRLNPFPVWMAAQLIPSMYNFENEIWISSAPLSSQMLSSPNSSCLGSFHATVNHYPLRLMTFNLHRQDFHPLRPWHVYLRSKYRDDEIISTYSLVGTRDKVFLGKAFEESSSHSNGK